MPTDYVLLGGTWPALETDINGRFGFDPPLPIGRYRVRVAAPGFDIAEVPIDIADQKISDIAVSLTRRQTAESAQSHENSHAVFVETAEGTVILELVAPDRTPSLTFLADVDSHRLEHVLGTRGDEEWRTIYVRQTRSRTWRWQIENDGSAQVVILTPSDKPNDPVRLRTVGKTTGYSESFFKRILAVSRLK